MKKFLLRILLISVPLVLALLVSEYSLRRVPNDYAYKNAWLEENAGDLKILVMGSSHGLYGINPAYFSAKAFNAAHSGQSLKYDRFIFGKFIDRMDSLKVLVLPVSYFSLHSAGIEAGAEPWRVKYYSIYYGCDYYPFEPKYNLEIYNIQPVELLKSFFGKASRITCSDLGFGTIHSKSCRKDDWNVKSGPEAARRHTKKADKDVVDKNVFYLDDMIQTCRKRNIQVLLLTTPVHGSYYDNLDKAQLGFVKEKCEDFQRDNGNVRYLDLMLDTAYTDGDFYDGDHLNEFGAAKLTRFLDAYIAEKNLLK